MVGARAGRGGDAPGLRARRKDQAIREGVLSTLPFAFPIFAFLNLLLFLSCPGRGAACNAAPQDIRPHHAHDESEDYAIVHLHGRAKRDYLHVSRACPLRALLKVCFALEFPQEPAQETPPGRPAEMPHGGAREPILTLPPALTAYVLLIALIHLRVLLPVDWEEWTVDVFGFIPKRYDTTLLDVTFPGGAGARIWTFVTYSLLHANLSHIGFNVLWLLPFGSALARRFGPLRFYLFMAVTAAAGALAHLVTHEHALAPMIGASASVSGTMAAAMRFAFVKGSFLSFSRGDADAAAKVPALSLWRALRNGRVLAFLAIWFGVNIIFGIGSLAVGMEEGQSVAWQAHIGGFFAGLILFALFDPVPRRESDAAAALSKPPN
jgi:membrane associated rhomboid family serine protease